MEHVRSGHPWSSKGVRNVESVHVDGPDRHDRGDVAPQFRAQATRTQHLITATLPPIMAHRQAGRAHSAGEMAGGAARLLLEHDLFRKPVPTPDKSGACFFGIML